MKKNHQPTQKEIKELKKAKNLVSIMLKMKQEKGRSNEKI